MLNDGVNFFCGDKGLQRFTGLHRHCTPVLKYYSSPLYNVTTSAACFMHQWQTIWFSNEMSLLRLVSVGFHRWVIVLICSWCSDTFCNVQLHWCMPETGWLDEKKNWGCQYFAIALWDCQIHNHVDTTFLCGLVF